MGILSLFAFALFQQGIQLLHNTTADFCCLVLYCIPNGILEGFDDIIHKCLYLMFQSTAEIVQQKTECFVIPVNFAHLKI